MKLKRTSGMHFPDLLGPTQRVQGFWCRGGEPTQHPAPPGVVHQSCGSGRHHFRRQVKGETVAGLTTRLGKIDRVYTKPGHRRQGHAQTLLRAARSQNPTLAHSSALTRAGRAWHDAMQRMGL